MHVAAEDDRRDAVELAGTDRVVHERDVDVLTGRPRLVGSLPRRRAGVVILELRRGLVLSGVNRGSATPKNVRPATSATSPSSTIAFGSAATARAVRAESWLPRT